MKRNILNLKNENGSFNAVIVKKGDKYGLRNCLTHDEDKPLIEFYDDDHPYDIDEHGNNLGQFVSRYYTDTLMENKGNNKGLCLYGGVPKWNLSAENMVEVYRFIESEVVQFIEIK